MFSAITDQFDLPTNRLYQIRDNFLRRRVRFVDLISGNVNAQGIVFPDALLQKALTAGARQSRLYHPHPLGQLAARKAISRRYAVEKLAISPEHILLTPGTSISYWYAFQLLTNRGDEILAPVPSYPLFDSIAGLCGVQLTPYRLSEPSKADGRWEIDFDQLEAALTPRTKAIVLISPHNPTGNILTDKEIHHVTEIATRRQIAILSDEVFSPFLYTQKYLPRPAETKAPLVITMNGFSKMLALPGMKIGWMMLTGERSLVEKSMKSLEMISDTFLPVHEAAQAAAPTLLLKSKAFQKNYRSEIKKRAERAQQILNDAKISFTKPEGGFFLVIPLDPGLDEEKIACTLLENHRVLVHPGYFYDLEGHHLVVSLVNRTPVFAKAVQALKSVLSRGTN